MSDREVTSAWARDNAKLDKKIAEAKAIAPAPVDPVQTVEKRRADAREITQQERGVAFIHDILDRACVDKSYDRKCSGPIFAHLNSLNGQPPDIDEIVNGVRLYAREMGWKRTNPRAAEMAKVSQMSERDFLNWKREEAQKGR